MNIKVQKPCNINSNLRGKGHALELANLAGSCRRRGVTILELSLIETRMELSLNISQDRSTHCGVHLPILKTHREDFRSVN